MVLHVFIHIQLYITDDNVKRNIFLCVTIWCSTLFIRLEYVAAIQCQQAQLRVRCDSFPLLIPSNRRFEFALLLWIVIEMHVRKISSEVNLPHESDLIHFRFNWLRLVPALNWNLHRLNKETYQKRLHSSDFSRHTTSRMGCLFFQAWDPVPSIHYATLSSGFLEQSEVLQRALTT